MRFLLALLLAALLPRPASAGSIVVDAGIRRVETPHLILRFDGACPEALRQVTYKGWSPTIDLTDDSGLNEFWGQSARGIAGPSHIRPFEKLVADWFVIEHSDSQAVIGIQSVTDGEPSVETVYTIPADQPWYEVRRTIFFDEFPETTAYQAHLPRIALTTTSRAVRFRNAQGQLLQRSFCFGGCEETDWDGRWIQYAGWTGVQELSIAMIPSRYHAIGPTFVRGRGPVSGADWAVPLVPHAPHTTAETSRMLVAFGRDVDDYARLDSLEAWYHDGFQVLDAPVAPPVWAERVLRASPSPARGDVTLAFGLSRAQSVSLSVYDVSGRRVAALHEGPLAAGEHSLRWDGRDARGASTPPGLYLARLVTAEGTWRARVVRVR